MLKNMDKFKKNDPNQKRYRINDRIKVRTVRLIGAEGEQIGVVSIEVALEQAKQQGLDLVETTPEAKPPVCKLTDFGKLKYEQSKKQKQLKKKSHTTETKTIKLTPCIGDNDLVRKIADAQRFLDKGNRVVVCMEMKGRQRQHPQIAMEKLNQITGTVKGQLQGKPSTQGAQITITFNPNPSIAAEASDD